MTLREDAGLLLANADEGSAVQRVAQAYLRADRNARETLRRWGLPEADTCIDPVLALCSLADGPTGPVDLAACERDYLEHQRLGGTGDAR